MGLFDNIFLDKDTPTTMLDPLIADKKKEETQLDEKIVASLPKSSPENKKDLESTIGIDSISFDDIEEHEPAITLNMQSSTENPAEILSSEEISFDIGGFDDVQIMGEETVTKTSSDNQTQSPNEMIVNFDNPSIPTIDTSIALVQGATSATSDAIMQTQSETANGSNATGSLTSFITETQSIQDSVGLPSEFVITEDFAHSQDNSLMNIIGDSSDQISDPSPIINILSPESSATTEPAIDLFSETVTPIAPFEAQVPTDTVSANTLNVSNTVTSISDSSVLVESFASHNRFSTINSPVDDMLIEFISKLEKFNSESTTLDTQMTNAEMALQQEEEDLRKEFEVRMSAISYKRQHMNQTKNERFAEKSRLEKIISHLKNEVA